MTAAGRRTLAALALAASAGTAHAHLTTTGLGPFYDGFVHPFVTPPNLLATLAAALLAGLRGPEAARWTMFALPGAWATGTVAGMLVPAGPAADGGALLGAAAVPTLLAAALAAADVRVPPGVVAALAAGIGALHGWLDGGDLAAAGAGGGAAAGTACAVFVATTLVAGQAAALRAPAARVVLRVAAAWIAAIGLLALGWSVREAVVKAA